MAKRYERVLRDLRLSTTALEHATREVELSMQERRAAQDAVVLDAWQKTYPAR